MEVFDGTETVGSVKQIALLIRPPSAIVKVSAITSDNLRESICVLTRSPVILF